MEKQDVKLYYFSGTGNSLKIAKDIGSALGNHELISIPKLLRENESPVVEGSLVGLVFPTYFARPPVIIRELVERAELGDIGYLFLIADGGGMFGRVLKICAKAIKEKGKSVDAGFIIGMPGNHPKMAEAQEKTPEEHYAAEAVRSRDIAESVKARKRGKLETNFGPLGFVVSHLFFKKPYKLSKAHSLDQAFWVTEECNNCSTCRQVCPMKNIIETKGKPEWLHDCINCNACYHHCPQEAIQLNGMDMKRYSHPEISLEEIISGAH